MVRLPALLTIGLLSSCGADAVQDFTGGPDAGPEDLPPTSGPVDLGVDTGVAQAALLVVTATLPDGEEGSDYAATVVAEGGSGRDYRWSVADGALPPGVFVEAEGTPGTTLSGRPSAAGLARFTLRVRDDELNEATQELSIAISAGLPELEFSTNELPPAPFLSPYEAVIEATGGSGQGYRWAVDSGQLAPGLRLAAGGTPRTTLSGTPTRTGRYRFTVAVSDDRGERAERSYLIEVVDDTPTLEIPAVTLPAGSIDMPYQASIPTMGGSGSGYTWRVLVGSLPPGLVLEANSTPNGLLTGTPLAVGTYAFRVEVQDPRHNTARRALFIEVGR